MSEVFVCKFDDKIQCANYACEEDISSLEVTKMECALHARLMAANKILMTFPDCAHMADDFSGVCPQFDKHGLAACSCDGEPCPISDWLNKLKFALEISKEKQI